MENEIGEYKETTEGDYISRNNIIYKRRGIVKIENCSLELIECQSYKLIKDGPGYNIEKLTLLSIAELKECYDYGYISDFDYHKELMIRETSFRKDFSQVIYTTCPGGPDPGCCEFCPGNCQSFYWPNGIELTEAEVDEYQDYDHEDVYMDEDIYKNIYGESDEECSH